MDNNIIISANETIESKMSVNSGLISAAILQQNNIGNIKQEQKTKQIDDNDISLNDNYDTKHNISSILLNDNETAIAASGNNNSNTLNNIGLIKNSENIQNKRKKSKSRSSHAQLNPSQFQQQQSKLQNNNYSKNHLDAWLESCLKDSASIGGPQLSSSSEFLDYNQSSFNNIQKKFTTQQQQLHQQQQQIQNQIHQPPQQFLNKFNNYNIPTSFHLGSQRNTIDNIFSNPCSLNNFSRNVMLNDDFASLPPIVNLTEYNNAVDSNLIEHNMNSDPTRSFRFSDPCLINSSENELNKMSGQNTPVKRNGNIEDNNKLFITLMEQINLLHETNSKICRNLHDTRIDIEALKNVPNFGNIRHRRDSLSGVSTHSQPLGGFAFGTHSPAPTYNSAGIYTPGVMTDVVREVKEAARVREDALLSRVKSMVEERSWSLGEGNLRMMRDIEELKIQIQNLRTDRKESNKRMTHLESENKYLKQLLTTMLQSREQNYMDYVRIPPTRSRYNSNKKEQAINNSPLNLNSFTTHESHGNSKSLYESNLLTNGANPCNQQNLSLNARCELNGSKTQLRITENYDLEGETNNESDKLDEHVFQMEKETLELRRELQEALANKKMAENRIIAIENAVKQLNHSNESTPFNNYKLRGQQELNSSNNQIASAPMQNLSGKKLTLAGPITDL